MIFPRKFFWQLFFSLILIFIITSILFGGLFYRYLSRTTLDNLKSSLRKETVMLAETIAGSPALLKDPSPLAKVVQTEDRITIMTVDGHVVVDNWAYRIRKTEIENHSDRPEFRAALAGNPIFVTRHSETVGRDMLYYAIPLKADGDVHYVLRLSFDLRTHHELMDGVLGFLLTTTALSMLLSVPIAFAFSKRNARQIQSLREGVRRIARGDLREKLAVHATEELSDLTRDFNEMADLLREKISNLQMEHNRIEALLSKMVEGVVALDVNGKAVFANAAFCEMVGVKPDRIHGRSFLEIARNDQLSKFISDLLSGSHNANIEAREIQIFGPAGEQIFSVQASWIIGAEEQPSMVLLVFHNITRIKRVEQIRKDFVANVSHELRTPLTALKGSTELLLDGAYKDSEESMKFLKIMDKHLQNMQNLVSDMLNLATVEDTRSTLRRQSVELSYLVSEVTALIVPLAEKKHQNLRVDIPVEPIVLNVDPVQLSDALTNLLDNAVKYSQEKAEIKLTAQLNRSGITFEVSDNGPGIPSDQLPRIFERFYRIDKSRSREIGGTGLGLSIVKHIVENHGGNLSVRSSLGKGTTFIVQLPQSALRPAAATLTN